MADIVVQVEGVGELHFPEGTPMDVIQAKVKELTGPTADTACQIYIPRSDFRLCRRD